MNYQISSDNMEISPSMKELAKEKMQKLENRFHNVADGSKSVRIVMNTAPIDQFHVKIELDADDIHLFTDETTYSLESALVLAIEELDRKLEKTKFGSQDWKEKRESKRYPTNGSEMI